MVYDKMFTYVHTTGDIIEDNQKKLIDEYVDCYLFSLIAGLRQQNFGFDTLHRVTQEIIKYNQVLGTDRKFFVDSGGYSIIAGDVKARSVAKFIECYNLFLERDAPEHCDHIFSLDIPIFLKEPQFNTVKYITEMNEKSIQGSLAVIEKNPLLYDKFIFVWQHKMLNQYHVWKKLYEKNLAANPKIKHFGVGGMVGLRGITNIQFSPFISMAYKCLDLIEKKNLNELSIIHMLGIYGLHDRVIMAFIQRLFNKYYLKDNECKVKITYDTVNYSLSGLYKLREQVVIIPENDKYIWGYAHDLIDKLDRIIDNPEILDIIKRGLDNVNNGEQVDNTRISSMLNVITQIMIDRIIDKEIIENNIVDLFIQNSSFNSFKNKMNQIFQKLEYEYPLIFGNRTKKNLINFQYCYAFHQWWLEGRDPNKLEVLIEKFIKLINFPADLSI
jgi:hypothetical protein